MDLELGLSEPIHLEFTPYSFTSLKNYPHCLENPQQLIFFYWVPLIPGQVFSEKLSDEGIKYGWEQTEKQKVIGYLIYP